MTLRDVLLFQDDDQQWEEIIDTICVGCDLPARTNELETLQQQVIQEYGAGYKLIWPPATPFKTPRKNKRSHSTSAQYKREIAAHAQRDYATEDVLQAAQVFLRDQTEEWVSFGRLAQHLYERFY